MGDIQEVIIASITMSISLILFLLRGVLKKYLNHLTLISIFLYNMYRLVLIKSIYSTVVKINLFMGGYTYAVFYMVLISRVSGNYPRLAVVISTFAIRFGLIIGWMDIKAFQAGSLIRGVIIDAFIFYYYYSNDKIERSVFMNFYQNREELHKFKELLDDTLPLSVTVIDCNNNRSLFSNHAFSKVFSSDHMNLSQPIITNPSDVSAANTFIGLNVRPCLSSLYVDLASVREMGSLPNNFKILDRPNRYMSLHEIMQNLIKGDALSDKAMSLTASYVSQDQKKLFDVALKRITWDRTDSLAIILNDITYQQKILSLKMANTNKDKIIATVSHEFRTPLNGILGLLDMAETHTIHPTALEYIALSKDNARLLLSLVNSYLDLQQIKAGKLRLNPCKTSIRKILNDVTQLFQFQTKQKGITLEASIGNNVPDRIITDENRLKQILINLLGNAIKFTYSGGIKVEVLQVPNIEQSLEIAVVDTGIGIKDEDQEKLFKMYERLEEGRSMDKNGVGLGLMISNMLATLLNGKNEGKGIEVTSKQAVGSRFSFRVLRNLSAATDIVINGNSNVNSKNDLLGKQKQNQQEGVFDKEDVVDSKDIESSNRKNYRGVIESEGHHRSSSLVDCLEDPSTPMSIQSKIANYISMKITHSNDLNHHQKSLKGLNSEEVKFKGKHSESQITMNNYPPVEKPIEVKRNNEYRDIKVECSIKTSCDPSPKNSYILLVDDNPFNLLVIENLLNDLGYPVKKVSGGREAIDVTKSFAKEGKTLKAILMDCMMPDMDGYETTRILKGMMERKEIPVTFIFALTANSNNEEEAKKCLDCGMTDYLTKPVGLETLKRVLNIK